MGTELVSSPRVIAWKTLATFSMLREASARRFSRAWYLGTKKSEHHCEHLSCQSMYRVLVTGSYVYGMTTNSFS